MTFMMHWKRKDDSEGVLTPKTVAMPTLAGKQNGVCSNGHVGTHGDVCTAVGCNGAPFR